MTIVMSGGGSGGHITPLLAVARELRNSQPSVRLIYVGEKNGKFQNIAEDSKLFDELHYVYAGKLRRYHGESFLRRITDVKTIMLNIRDLFRLGIGTVQATMLIRRLKPSAMLLKGGFVCVPVAIGGKLARVPMITHDSDATPGLANRFAAKYAMLHATAMPAKYYRYPKDTIRVVGVPLDERFRLYTDTEKAAMRQRLGVDSDNQVIFITGGSNGAQRLNGWVIEALPELLDAYPKLEIIHHVGSGNESQYDSLHEAYRARVHMFDFTDKMYEYGAIADIIVTRAGATTMAEFAAESKACIVVPHPDLAGGHQLKNARVYADADAAIVIQELQLKQNIDDLVTSISDLLENDSRRKELGAHLRKTLPEIPAATALSQLLLEVSK